MTDELKHIIQLIDDMRDNRVIEAAIRAHVQKAIDDEKQNPWKGALIDELIVDNILTEELERDPRKALAVAIDWNCKVALDPSASAEARALQQAAIDAALIDLTHDLGSLYIHRNGHELYNSAIDDVARFIKDQLGTNPLAERDARISELGSLLAEAYADADDVLRPQIEELEHMLSEEPHNIPTKCVQHGGVTFALHGSSSIRAYEELERELDELREDAERYRWLRDEDNWGDDTENRWAILGELTHGEFDNWIDAAMRQEGE